MKILNRWVATALMAIAVGISAAASTAEGALPKPRDGGGADESR
ncbi:hypothetical protein [Bradyrhizobium sp. Ce-3]|nr:hypothetical protein [Bradyrhizobium sp. Ce-3]